jgi:hypothetical protein
VFVRGADERAVIHEGGEYWRAYGPVDAPSGDAAINRVRDGVPKLKADKSAMFDARANFEPKRMVRRYVETYDLRPASELDEEPPTEQMEVTQ